MTALAVGVGSGPMERVAADVAVVAFFSDERPLRGDAGRVDWRLCGALSRLILREKLAGTWGEAALVPSTGGVRAAWVLALGLGERRAFDAARQAESTRSAVARALDLHAEVLALPLPPAPAGAGSDPDPAGRLDLRIEALGEAAAASARAGSSVRIRLVPSEGEHAAVSERLQILARRSPPAGLVFEPPEPGARAARRSSGAARSASGATSAGARVE